MTNGALRTVVVTGGAGFIGCAISGALANKFDRVVVVDILHPQIHHEGQRPAALHPDAELIKADVTDAEAWDRLLGQYSPDVIIHLAAETGTGQSLTESFRHTDTNVSGTAVMLDALHRSGKMPSRIVLSSSRAVYGEGAWCRRAGEIYYPGVRTRTQLEKGDWNFEGEPVAMSADRVRPGPVSIYGATKLTQEQILSIWCDAMRVELVTLRLQNVYGPGQSLKNSYTGIVSLFCQIARQGKEIPLYEDGKVIRDFVLIDDVANALIKAVDAPASATGKIFDIGCGVKTTIGEIADEISSIYNAPAPKITGQFRPGDVRHAYGDISAAVSNLQWEPRYTVAAGLRELSAWIDGQLSGDRT